MFKRSFAAAILVGLSLVVGPSALFSQTQWDRLPTNPVLAPGPPGSWDSTTAVVNTVLYHDGIYKMWYEGDDSFGYAESNDGITWQKWVSNPIMQPGPEGAWDEMNIDQASVLIVGDTFHMFYSGVDALDDNRIGHATSPDGIAWERDPANPVIDIGTPASWDTFEAIHPFVLYENGEFRMWYNGHDGLTQRIIYATSPDGTVWTRFTGFFMLEAGQPGSWDDDELGPLCVRPYGNTYDMWYTGWNTAGEFRIGYATSPDGLTWSKHPDPVLEPGIPGSWDDGVVAVPFVTVVDSLVMYYGGTDGVSFQTGYAGSPRPVPTLLKNHSATWRGSGIEVSWTLWTAGADDRFSVRRRELPDTRYADLDAAITRNGMSFMFVDTKARPGTSYQYAVQLSENETVWKLFETNVVTVPALRLSIERVSPNPFNPRTSIEYRIVETGPVTLAIYDVSGSLVRALVDEPRAPGRHTAEWLGLDEDGAAVASGVYFIRLVSAGQVRTHKAVLAK